MNITERKGAVRVTVYVQPRASRSEVVGEHGDAVKIRLAAPPVDGAANDELRRFIAKLLGIAASRVEIVAGESSRQKIVQIAGVTAEQVRTAFEAVIKPK